MSRIQAQSADIQAPLQLLSHGSLVGGLINTRVDSIISQLQYV